MRVLTWNLWHGRSLPPARRDLMEEFATLIGGWDWDVALLQEVPPWWPAFLARWSRAHWCRALTSRNALLPMRRLLATRWPNLIRSNGGGCNAVLVRGEVVGCSSIRLRVRPERRVAQLARLDDGACLVNFHGSARVALAEAELERLWSLALAWAQEAPLILGGDLNLRSPRAGAADVLHVARRDVDHIFARGFEPGSEAELLDRRAVLEQGPVELSDHPPLAVSLRSAAHSREVVEAGDGGGEQQ
jgi:endonuclease/exonuclease/phosphatase family metal-dependent hydrolase